MKVKELIRDLTCYDGEREVFFMKERKDDDVTYADEIHEVKQKMLTRDDFETVETIAVTLVNHEESLQSTAKAEGGELPTVKSSTNSDLGSYHWFHTLIAKHKDIGEFLKENTADESLLKIWGEQLYETSKELIDGFSRINQLQSLPKEPIRDELIKEASDKIWEVCRLIESEATIDDDVSGGYLPEPEKTWNGILYSIVNKIDEYLNSKSNQ